MTTRRFGPLLASSVAMLAACTSGSNTSNGSQPEEKPAASTSSGAGERGLSAAVKQLAVQGESRSGYEREKFKLRVDAERSLVAVTLGTNRSKGDQDPAEWLPPANSARCTYAADWVATKLRWKLALDRAEHAVLERLADSCPDAAVDVEPVS